MVRVESRIRLISAAPDEVGEVRLSAVNALGGVIHAGPRTRAVLIEMLTGQDARLRSCAQMHLPTTRGRSVKQRLCSRCQTPLRKRFSAAYGLSAVGTSAALALLQNTADTDNRKTLWGKRVSDEAKEAIEQIRSRLSAPRRSLPIGLRKEPSTLMLSWPPLPPKTVHRLWAGHYEKAASHSSPLFRGQVTSATRCRAHARARTPSMRLREYFFKNPRSEEPSSSRCRIRVGRDLHRVQPRGFQLLSSS